MVKVNTLGDLEANRGFSPFNISTTRNTSSTTPLISYGRPRSDGTFENTTCLQAFSPEFNAKSFTFIVTMSQIVLFLICKVYSWYLGGGDWMYSCTLYKFGAKYTPAIVVDHEFYRLLAPVFLHGGWLHIISNMYSQWIMGYFLEAQYGTKKFAILYLLSGIGGNLLSAVWRTNGLSIGASSSLFGILALRCAYLAENYYRLGPGRNQMIFWTAIVIVGNVLYGQQSSEIDNEGHIGGFWIGILIAIQYIKWDSDRKFYVKQKIALWVAVLWTAAICIYLATLRSSLESSVSLFRAYCPQ